MAAARNELLNNEENDLLHDVRLEVKEFRDNTGEPKLTFTPTQHRTLTYVSGYLIYAVGKTLPRDKPISHLPAALQLQEGPRYKLVKPTASRLCRDVDRIPLWELHHKGEDYRIPVRVA